MIHERQTQNWNLWRYIYISGSCTTTVYRPYLALMILPPFALTSRTLYDKIWKRWNTPSAHNLLCENGASKQESWWVVNPMCLREQPEHMHTHTTYKTSNKLLFGSHTTTSSWPMQRCKWETFCIHKHSGSMEATSRSIDDAIWEWTIFDTWGILAYLACSNPHWQRSVLNITALCCDQRRFQSPSASWIWSAFPWNEQFQCDQRRKKQGKKKKKFKHTKQWKK